MTYARGYAIFYADLVFLLLHFLSREGIFLLPAEDENLTVAEDFNRGGMLCDVLYVCHFTGKENGIITTSYSKIDIAAMTTMSAIKRSDP